MGYRLNCLDGPVFIAVPTALLTEFDIHHRFESCVSETEISPFDLKFMDFWNFLDSGNKNKANP